MDRKSIIDHSRRVVVKLGTAVLMRDESGLALSRFYSFVEGIADLKRSGREVLLVTSGAVGLGVQKLGFTRRPKLVPQKQACAAVGQGRLMALYSDAFDRLGITTAQVLLTEEDFSNRERYLNLRSCITELLQLGVLPIINENDTVSTAEIAALKDNAPQVKVNFGDNDRLSALVASKVEADVLVILTDVDGLFTGDPRQSSEAKLIPEVDEITEEIEHLAAGSSTKVGRGGMRTKLSAAKIATQSGCATIIVGGKQPEVLTRVFAGEELGTLFKARPGLTGKKRWIAFATTVRAELIVNAGAHAAVVRRKASLLPAGLVEVKGKFERGDVVSIINSEGTEFARGIVNYSSDEITRILGMRSDAIDEMIEDRNYDAIITRDNIALLVESK